MESEIISNTFPTLTLKNALSYLALGMNLSLNHEFDHLENTEHFQNVESFIIEHETK